LPHKPLRVLCGFLRPLAHQLIAAAFGDAPVLRHAAREVFDQRAVVAGFKDLTAHGAAMLEIFDSQPGAMDCGYFVIAYTFVMFSPS
jgi:hypothetical protein